MSSLLGQRASRRIAIGAWLFALSLPFLGLALLNRPYIAYWLSTGTCPGPMDRSGPCGVGRMLGIVFLGGWAAFAVVPVLLAWSMVWTVALFAVLGRLRRPAT